MPENRFILGICLAVVWISSGLTRGEEASRVLPAPRANPKHIAGEVDPKGAQILLQLVVVELRGDVQRAFKETGFSDSVAGNRFMPRSADRVDSEPDRLSTLLRAMSAHAEVSILSRPQIRTIMGQSATVTTSSAPSQIPYLVRTGAKTFELREAVSEITLGLNVELTPRSRDDSQDIEISPLKISTTTCDGREPIPGLELDVGKPIFSTRTLETSITLNDGGEASGIAIPGPAGRQPVLFIRGQRVRPTQGGILPSPLPGLAPPASNAAAKADQPAKNLQQPKR